MRACYLTAPTADASTASALTRFSAVHDQPARTAKKITSPPLPWPRTFLPLPAHVGRSRRTAAPCPAHCAVAKTSSSSPPPQPPPPPRPLPYTFPPDCKRDIAPALPFRSKCETSPYNNRTAQHHAPCGYPLRAPELERGDIITVRRSPSSPPPTNPVMSPRVGLPPSEAMAALLA